jgi:hypothetical protein
MPADLAERGPKGALHGRQGIEARETAHTRCLLGNGGTA